MPVYKRVLYLGETANSSRPGSGSDHTKSAIGPSCGISMSRKTPSTVSHGMLAGRPKNPWLLGLSRRGQLPLNRSMTLIWSIV